MTPVTGISADTDPENTPSLTVGDSIYYHHPESNEPTHGLVASVGKHGVTTDSDDGQTHQVKWEKFIGHRKRMERKLTIHDKGEDGTIMIDENGRKVFVRGGMDDYMPDEKEGGKPMAKSLAVDPVVPAEPSLLEKAQVVRELAQAGFEPMVDYVRDTFGDNFVYKLPPAPVAVDTSAAVTEALERLSSAMASQFNGLAAAVSLLADKVMASDSLTQSLMAVLAEARKPQAITIQMPEGPRQAALVVQNSPHLS